MGHGGLTADQAQQGQTQNGLKGMSDPSGHPGIRHLLQALEQRFRRLHINTPPISLPYLIFVNLPRQLCNRPALDAGQPFVTRAAYYNASYFTDESPVQLVFGDVRLPPPYNLSVENRLLSEDPLSYEVRASWEAPVVVVEGADASSFDWGYFVRLNEGQPYKSDGQSQEDLFIWTLPGLLAVRAMVWMDCKYTAATSICDVNYGGVDYDIPGTELWVSTWSNAGSVNLVGVVAEAGSVVGPSEPDPAVIQLIYAIFDGIGQELSATLAKTLSVLLCLALGLAGGAFILSRVGVTFIGVVLSAAFFMFIFAGLGIFVVRRTSRPGGGDGCPAADGSSHDVDKAGESSSDLPHHYRLCAAPRIHYVRHHCGGPGASGLH